MLKKRRKKALEEGHTNNIWNRHDFVMCGLGEKDIVRHHLVQRIVEAYEAWDKCKLDEQPEAESENDNENN